MNFEAIFRKSLSTAWNNKSLWIFGMFAMGMSGIDFNMGIDQSAFGFEDEVPDMQQLLEMMAPLTTGVILFSIISWIISIISQTALIDSCNKLTRGGVYSFKDSYSAGLNFFWRMLGITFLSFSVMIITSLVMIFIGIGTFALNQSMGVLVLLGMIPIGMIGFFFYFSIFILALRALVIRNVSIGDAVYEGWQLVKTNKLNCLILLIAAFFFVVAVLIIFWIARIPFSLIASFLPEGLEMIINAVVYFIASLIVGGFGGAFIQNVYTIFYLSLFEPETARE